LRRIHQRDGRPEQLANRVRENWKVRAAQNEHVRRVGREPGEYRIEIARDDRFDDRSVGPASSASATNSEQACAVTRASARRRRIDSWYAPPCTVPSVPMTTMWPVRLAAQAACAPGSTTPTTGSGAHRSRKLPSAKAEAVLQATTRT